MQVFLLYLEFHIRTVQDLPRVIHDDRFYRSFVCYQLLNIDIAIARIGVQAVSLPVYISSNCATALVVSVVTAPVSLAFFLLCSIYFKQGVAIVIRELAQVMRSQRIQRPCLVHYVTVNDRA